MTVSSKNRANIINASNNVKPLKLKWLVRPVLVYLIFLMFNLVTYRDFTVLNVTMHPIHNRSYMYVKLVYNHIIRYKINIFSLQPPHVEHDYWLVPSRSFCVEWSESAWVREVSISSAMRHRFLKASIKTYKGFFINCRRMLRTRCWKNFIWWRCCSIRLHRTIITFLV